MKKKIITYWDVFVTKLCNLLFLLSMTDERCSHIAMFHDIVDENKEKDLFDCKLSELDDYISYCQKIGMKFVCIDELLSDKRSACMKHVVLTFDDGFESIYTVVLPYMRKKNIPFTIYVSTSMVDKEGYLSQEQLKILSEEPLCTIGMHAHEHILFRFEGNKKLQEDFEQCKEFLCNVMGKFPVHYAFPYGSRFAVSNRNCRVIKRKGVQSIALTHALKIRKNDIKKPWHLPRLNIPGYYNGTVPRKMRGLEIGEHD